MGTVRLPDKTVFFGQSVVREYIIHPPLDWQVVGLGPLQGQFVVVTARVLTSCPGPLFGEAEALSQFVSLRVRGWGTDIQTNRQAAPLPRAGGDTPL